LVLLEKSSPHADPDIEAGTVTAGFRQHAHVVFPPGQLRHWISGVV
jgi:hypothetical protein